ncbi:MAG TPA: addiction module protein [Reyranella sp.]|jgi:putative addiction module component (TIGR02574 family)
MTTSSIDPKSLTVEERLDLIEKLWNAIADDAQRGDPAAIEAMEFDEKVDPGLLTELNRRIEEHRNDPSTGVPWETLNEELKRRFG